MLVELFPASNRSSASAIGFNIALAFIAGPAAYIGTWLAGTTGDPASPAWYMVLLAVIPLPFQWKWLPETAGRDMPSEGEAVLSRVHGDAQQDHTDTSRGAGGTRTKDG